MENLGLFMGNGGCAEQVDICGALRRQFDGLANNTPRNEAPVGYLKNADLTHPTS